MKKHIILIVNLILWLSFEIIAGEIKINIYNFTSLPFSEFTRLNTNVIDVSPSSLIRSIFYLTIYAFFLFYIPYTFMYEIFKNKKIRLTLFFIYPIVYIFLSSLSMSLLYLYFYVFSKII